MDENNEDFLKSGPKLAHGCHGWAALADGFETDAPPTESQDRFKIRRLNHKLL